MSKMMLTAKLNQQLLMSQQLKQAISMLQYTTLELKQQVENIVETNPLVELSDESDVQEETWHYTNGPSYKTSQYTENFDDAMDNVASIQTLREYLLSQTLNCQFDRVNQRIAEGIIDAIDDNGYLTMSLEEIRDIIQMNDEVTMPRLEHVLSVIQKFDPTGVAARNTKECLQLQIEAISNKLPKHEYAIKILQTDSLSLDQFNLAKVAKVTKLNEEQLTEGLKVIKTLNFNPGKGFNVENEAKFDPELYVRKIDNQWRVFLSESILTRIEVSKQYKSLIRKNARDKSYKTVLDQLNEAQLLINAIKRRNNTLLEVGEYIVKHQSAFFDDGKSSLKSMNMADVAKAIDCHESTVSRITTGKYIATPYGVYELKYFFPSHVKTAEGSGKSSIAVKSMIEQLIASEDAKNRYSDDQLAALLEDRGIKISRRTVTKYREALGVPSSYVRSNMTMVRQGLGFASESAHQGNVPGRRAAADVNTELELEEELA